MFRTLWPYRSAPNRLGDMESSLEALRNENERLREAQVRADAQHQAFELILAEMKSFRVTERAEADAAPDEKEQ